MESTDKNIQDARIHSVTSSLPTSRLQSGIYGAQSPECHRLSSNIENITMTAQLRQYRRNSFKMSWLVFTLLFCASANTLRADIGSIYEQLLRTEPGVQIADRELNVAYKSLRDRLNPGSRTQLKSAQLSWIMARDQALAATPCQQRPAVALQWSASRAQSLAGNLNQLNGIQPVSPPLPEPQSQTTQVPQPEQRPLPVEVTSADIELASILSRDIATFWKDTRADTSEMPQQLSSGLVERLEKLVPQLKTDPAEFKKGRFPALRLAYSIDHALGSKPLNLHAIAEMCAAGQHLKPKDVPWLESISLVLDARRTKAITLQEQAMTLMENGDNQAAESRLVQAIKEFPSPDLTAYSTGLVLFNNLSKDKALRAVDSDWKKPSLPDSSLLKKAPEQAALLRAAEGPEILPSLTKLTHGLEAAGLLGSFLGDYEPAGDKDQPHPIRAYLALHKMEKYRSLKADESIFVKPFLMRLNALDELIGPKAAEFEKLVDQARGLEKDDKYLAAAAQYRLALNIEFSTDLEQTASRCESKTIGL